MMSDKINMRSLGWCIVGVLMAFSMFAGPDGDRIAQEHKVVSRNTMLSYDRLVFEFEGCEAWIVEPKTPAGDGRWVWCMEWPSAFQDRTGVKELLDSGYRWVTFNPSCGFFNPSFGYQIVHAGNQSDEMVAKRHRFQRYLVKALGLNEKCCLVGMSWGGFYSVRYASIHPECVKAIYLDAPLLDFSTLASYRRIDKNTGKVVGEYEKLLKFYDFATADYVGADDPFQSVNRAASIAKAKIPILLLYGGKDTVVPPEKNCERFAPAFVKNGGELYMEKRWPFGHHPHGVDPAEVIRIVNFFQKAYNKSETQGDKNK